VERFWMPEMDDEAEFCFDEMSEHYWNASASASAGSTTLSGGRTTNQVAEPFGPSRITLTTNHASPTILSVDCASAATDTSHQRKPSLKCANARASPFLLTEAPRVRPPPVTVPDIRARRVALSSRRAEQIRSGTQARGLETPKLNGEKRSPSPSQLAFRSKLAKLRFSAGSTRTPPWAVMLVHDPPAGEAHND
jgi:hypothetical protein